MASGGGVDEVARLVVATEVQALLNKALQSCTSREEKVDLVDCVHNSVSKTRHLIRGLDSYQTFCERVEEEFQSHDSVPQELAQLCDSIQFVSRTRSQVGHMLEEKSEFILSWPPIAASSSSSTTEHKASAKDSLQVGSKRKSSGGRGGNAKKQKTRVEDPAKAATPCPFVFQFHWAGTTDGVGSGSISVIKTIGHRLAVKWPLTVLEFDDDECTPVDSGVNTLRQLLQLQSTSPDELGRLLFCARGPLMQYASL